MSFAGFPGCATIELKAAYVERAAIRAQEAYFSGNQRRFEVAMASLEEKFAELSAQMVEIRAERSATVVPFKESAA